MKIILSPSKTQKIRNLQDIEGLRTEELQDFMIELTPLEEDIKYLKKQKKLTKELMLQLKAIEKELIAKKMKLKGDLLENTMADLKELNRRNIRTGAAGLSYTGTVFKELEVESYDDKAFSYMNEHLMILSALYGPIPAFAPVQAYRLDMTMSLFEINLYSYWKEIYCKRFKKEDLIIDLASLEFSKQVKEEKLTFEFLQPVKDGYKAIAYHSKQSRGLMANYLIKNQITELEDIKKFNALGYVFDEELSKPMHYVFKKINKKEGTFIKVPSS